MSTLAKPKNTSNAIEEVKRDAPQAQSMLTTMMATNDGEADYNDADEKAPARQAPPETKINYSQDPQQVIRQSFEAIIAKG